MLANHDTYRALIVDDEQIVRRTLCYALEHVGITCDIACDGVEALGKLARHAYDLVVTDLRMPRKNGHSLAVEVLAQPARPVIIIHTSINEPRLIKDLLTRGVDEIVQKPTNYEQFAARARHLIEESQAARHLARDGSPAVDSPHAAGAASWEQVAEEDQPETPVTLKDLTERLARLASVLPMSQAALDVVELVREGKSTARQIGAAIARDPSLAIEVLRLANSSFYNPAGQKISELERAVMRIGMRRVGQLAMTATALTSLTSNLLPWLDASLAWRRSIAAGLAVDSLVDQAGLENEHEDLFLSALMNGLGRVALGTLYTDEYAAMIQQSKQTNQSLLELEMRRFPETHAEVMVRLLDLWKLPGEICSSLKDSLIPFASLQQLEPQQRKRVTLLKLGILIGDLAVGQCEPWDVVDLPQQAAIDDLGLDALSQTIEQIRAGLFHVVHYRQSSAARGSASPPPPAAPAPGPRIAYCRLSAQPLGFLPHVIAALNFTVENRVPAELGPDELAVVDAVDCSFPEALAQLGEQRARHSLLIVSGSPEVPSGPAAHHLALPSSFAALRSAIGSLRTSPATPHPQPPLPLGSSSATQPVPASS